MAFGASQKKEHKQVKMTPTTKEVLYNIESSKRSGETLSPYDSEKINEIISSPLELNNINDKIVIKGYSPGELINGNSGQNLDEFLNKPQSKRK